MIISPSGAGRSFDASALYGTVLPDVTTFAVGDIVMLTPDANGDFLTCTTPTAAGIGTTASDICSDAVFGVVTHLKSNGYVKVTVQGLVQATVVSTSNAAIAVDASLIVNTSKRLEVDQATGDTNKKWAALNVSSVSGGATSTPTLRSVWFDGWYGFGRMGGTVT